MIQVKDNQGIVRPAEAGERVRFRNGSEYTMGRRGELRVDRPSRKEDTE